MRQSIMERSMEPEAMRSPTGSKRQAKTSPEWPASSIMGACSPLGAWDLCERVPFSRFSSIETRSAHTLEVIG